MAEEDKKEKITEAKVKIFGEEINMPKKSGRKTGRRNAKKEEKEEKKQEKKQDKEEWFQEKFLHHHHYHHYCGNRCNCMGSVFGLLFILGGLVFLFNNIGYISWDFWFYVKPFWPVILVLVGIKLLLGRNWFSSFFTFIVGLAIFTAVIVYGLVRSNSFLANYIPPEAMNSINNFEQMPFNQFMTQP